ncbi:hypothetical protein MMMB2_0395 [Mycobacterium marinum MB2]|uniref:Uncharacterized protein n=1 Tax=Mycobacterium ulcerans str. Harvey TaxID=1299332 RepID=A0ABN0QTX0_MYCUL|nr:hypothetical protein MMMB2_0395 [Mycobacterium marinum MB2]EUA88140.1 hypothetical protein I551_5379 [Mycobacterium ulcerans str. Harvey]
MAGIRPGDHGDTHRTTLPQCLAGAQPPPNRRPATAVARTRLPWQP